MSESHTTPESAVTLIDVEEFARSLRAQGTPWSQGCANVLEKLWEQYLYELRCNIALSETTYSTTNAAPQDAPGRKAGDGTGEAAETRQADGIGHSVTSGRRDLRAAAADPGCDVRENPGTTPAGAAPALPDKERDAHTALVHEVCDRIKFFERDVHCFRCSPNVETPYGKGTPGCFAMANETVSIVLRSQEALALSAGEGRCANDGKCECDFPQCQYPGSPCVAQSATEALLREARNELAVIASYADDPETNVGLRVTARRYKALVEKIDAADRSATDGA